MKKLKKILLIVICFIAGIIILDLLFIRPWQLRWGATDEEVEKVMPGDDILKIPDFNATRVVTINASADKIFPWLVQMGDRRAGWYSYDFLDNHGRPSAEKIIPEFQHLAVGDRISRDMWITRFKKDEYILIGGKGNEAEMIYDSYYTPYIIFKTSANKTLLINLYFNNAYSSFILCSSSS